MSFALTPEQEAVLAFGEAPGERDLLCFAVAGAGKTEITVRKIRRLIERGVWPEKILLTTFSKRGTADMRCRLATLGVSGRVEAKTLHALARKILWGAPEMTRDPQLPPKWAAVNVVNRVLKRFQRQGWDKDLLPKVKDVLGEITLAKASLIWPGTPADGAWFGEWTTADGVRYPGFTEWATTRARDPFDPKDNLLAVYEACYKEVEDVFRAPEAARKIDNKTGRVLDLPMFPKLVVSPQGVQHGRTKLRLVPFDDMIAMAARVMLERAPFVMRHKGEYSWVFCDECQDNSEGQWVMARFLAREHLVVIGDDMQAIFGFRGARPDLMKTFAEAPTTKTQPLSSNFRCGQEVLDAANGLLANAPDRLYKGSLVCGRGTKARVTAVLAGNPEDEARVVLDEIEAAIKEGANPDGIAILYRINAQAGPYEIEAIKRGVPYKVAGRSFFNRPEIAAAIGYLACSIDPTDERGWRACANVPTRMLGDVFFQNAPSLANARIARSKGNLGGAGRGFWASGVDAAETVIEGVSGLLAAGNLPGALNFVFEDTGVRKFFREDGADEESETDVDEACSALVACAGAVGDAAKLVSYARSMSKVGHEDVGEHEGERTAEPRVTLSTVHKAKGLEWKTVFATGMVEGLFPFMNADIAEERRLGYVALTRARDVMHVTGYTHRSEDKPVEPSRFFYEAKLLSLASPNAAIEV